MARALIVIDYQYDFVSPAGKLAVPGAEQLRPYIEALVQGFRDNHELVVATMDWHSSHHVSFTKWGEHCVANDPGAALMLKPEQFNLVLKKGTDPLVDSLSAFYDEAGNPSSLHAWLQERQVDTLVLVGVATDVCVAKTARDAIKLGYRTQIDLQGCAGFAPVLDF